MQIIGGDLKGKRLSIKKVKGIRPTSARVREALFNILSPRIEGAQFLDLYTGSGAIGIEAISRGARATLFIDKSPGAIRSIGTVLKDYRGERFQLRVGTVVQALKGLIGEKKNLISYLSIHLTTRTR